MSLEQRMRAAAEARVGVASGLTAFVQELWPVPPAVFSDEWFESSPAPEMPSGVAAERPGSREHSRAPEPGHFDLAVSELQEREMSEWVDPVPAMLAAWPAPIVCAPVCP